jgi:hypothetical protein
MYNVNVSGIHCTNSYRSSASTTSIQSTYSTRRAAMTVVFNLLGDLRFPTAAWDDKVKVARRRVVSRLITMSRVAINIRDVCNW